MEKKMESDADGKLLKMGKKEDAFSFSLGPAWQVCNILHFPCVEPVSSVHIRTGEQKYGP
jgi:hypothetical protein